VKTRLLVLAVATACVVALSYVGFVGTARAGRATPAASPAATDVSGMTYSTHELARLITAFERDVHRAPNSTGLSFLGGLYLQRARLTGDLGSYEQAGAALADALRRAPDDPEALGREASYLYRTHDFAGALALATRVTAADPSALGALAVLGDAQVELGRDSEAAGTYLRLAAAAPETPSVDVRRSHLAFLTGDIADAERFAARAEREAVASGEFGVGLAYYREARAQLRGPAPAPRRSTSRHSATRRATTRRPRSSPRPAPPRVATATRSASIERPSPASPSPTTSRPSATSWP
jgi:Flp pilus assembly protein TadD